MGGKWGCVDGHRAAYGLYGFLFVGVWLIASVGCKPIPPPTQSTDDLSAGLPAGSDHLLFSPNDFQVRLTRYGEMYEGVWNSTPVIYMAGLWVGGLQQGVPRGTITWIGTSPYSNFTTRWDSVDVGLYRFWPEHVTDPTFPWPTAFGAPTDPSGGRAVYGDEMAWSAMQSDLTHTTPVLSEPIRDLRVTQSVYGYTRTDLRNALFVRYDLKNLGAEPLTDAYVGYYSDTDLSDSSLNAIGYDAERGISYTYTPDQRENPEFFYVSGFAFLDAPMAVPAHGVTAHRMMWKNDFPLYGEMGMTSAQQIWFALQGRGNDGSPMVDPTTEQETPYAFTGDPIARTGWLDIQRDVRNMISCGPFVLDRDDAVALTVVWVVERDRSLEAAIDRMKVQVDQIHGTPSLWDF